ncbi:ARYLACETAMIDE DEACETYLASE [Salix purpurea]|uniref:ARYLACETAMIDE DEACETYLASE n=1 Tax=Salix purpurea TaxID=77065 RepID=A0A9Q0WFU5_SALPP|nr:ARYLACETAMIDE DEACETYLASE [Salix purpurea]
MTLSGDNEVAIQFPFFNVFKDGRVELLWSDLFPKTSPSHDLITGVRSKDVIISTEPQVSTRIFLPELKTPDQKFPLLLYVHGGGFVMFSAFDAPYHLLCSKIAAEANVIVVSVEYGLFPARPLPACYEDSWKALQWVASHADGGGSEPWLNDHADFGEVFVGGDSAGGNISHTLAFRVGSIGLPGVRLVGIIMAHPFFGGTEDDEMWLYMCTDNRGLDDPRMNPGLEELAMLGCERVLIFVAEKDYLNVVGRNYYEKLKKSGWKGSVEIVENENEGHCFFLRDFNCEKSLELTQKVVSFLKQASC